jgi:DNA oxidative demethylase
MADLFENVEPLRSSRESMATGAVVLHGNALAFEDVLLAALQAVTAQAPFRHMVTPGGFPMSVSMTNCGAVGWVTGQTGYRYDRVDPESSLPWPALPEVFRAVAAAAAAEAGYPKFVPDACLINR